MELRPYQRDIISAVQDKLASGTNRVLIQSPTGSGKTVMFAFLMREYAQRAQPAWIVCHRRELVAQTVGTLKAVGLAPSVIAAGASTEEGSPDLVVASLQTLVRRYKKLSKPDLIIWDEAHHIKAKSWSTVMEWADTSAHIGLSATPIRTNGSGLNTHFQSLITGPSVSTLIQQGYLSQYRLYAPSAPSLKGLRTRMGDWIQNDLADAMDRPLITGCAVDHYKRLCPSARAVVFAVNVAHSKSVAEQFTNSGFRAAHIDGGISNAERDRILSDFRQGIIRILCNCDLFGEGLDIPGIEAAILLRPTQSTGLYLQQVGRALRPAPGKSEAIILDHAGNASRHGLPCEEREWSLFGTKKGAARDGIPGPRICTSCFAANKPGTTVCQWCGARVLPTEREIKQQEGELVEICKFLAKKRKRTEVGRARTLADLVRLGKERGYKNPEYWARCVYRGRNK